jgi:RNA polymerase-binding transcription factor DksA
MSDEIDDAQQLQIQQTEIAIADTVAQLHVEGTANCLGCGDPIDPERRKAYPAARHCIECKKRRERKVP